MRIHIPIRLPSLPNLRVSWQKMASIKKKHKSSTKRCIDNWLKYFGAMPPMPLLVTITRLGPHELDDDNLASSAKYVRDQIAASVGVDDGNKDYTWRYEQRVEKEYGVEVEITTR